MEIHPKYMSTYHHLHRNCAIACSLVVAAVFGIPCAAQMGLGLVPMRSELNIAPGQQVSGSLKLSSQSGSAVRIRGEVDDFYIDANDTPQFERDIPQESANSCKNWLTLNPMEIQLDKGGSLLVRYTIRVPKDTPEGSYNCAAGFTTLRPVDAEANQGVGMRMEVRIVGALYVRVGSPAVVASLKEIKLEQIPVQPVPAASGAAQPAQPVAGKWQAVVVLANSGHMYFRPSGKLEVLNDKGDTVESADFPSMAVLRDRTQRVIFPLKTDLEPGSYKLRVNVDMNTGEIQQGTVDVVVDPRPKAAMGVAPSR
jgi:hypothetical protein